MHAPPQSILIAFQETSKMLEKERGEDDTKLLSTVPNVLHIFKETQLRCNLRVLGSQLGLNIQDMDGIESKEKKNRRRLEQLLDICSQRGLLNWNHIVDTLKKPALEKHGRKTIEMLYIRALQKGVFCFSSGNVTLSHLTSVRILLL